MKRNEWIGMIAIVLVSGLIGLLIGMQIGDGDAAPMVVTIRENAPDTLAADTASLDTAVSLTAAPAAAKGTAPVRKAAAATTAQQQPAPTPVMDAVAQKVM